MIEDRRSPGDLTLVEIAERLEKVTAAIEAERTQEREARRVYREVADRVDANVAAIRAYAKDLVDEQRRRMASFDGMFARNGARNGAPYTELKPGAEPFATIDDEALEVASPRGASGGRLNIYEAIMRVWTLDKYREPLTTSEISRAIKDVGYVTRAAPRSMKSTLNQALAKLCRDRLVKRFRTDGAEISPDDHHSRARKYMIWEQKIGADDETPNL